jgi:hypothetical protein
MLLGGFTMNQRLLNIGMEVQQQIESNHQEINNRLHLIPERLTNADALHYYRECEKQICDFAKRFINDDNYTKNLSAINSLIEALRKQFSEFYRIGNKVQAKMCSEKLTNIRQIFGIDSEISELQLIDETISHLKALRTAKSGLEIGEKGEKDVLYFIKSFDDQFLQLNNLRVKCDNQYAESDLIIFHPNGIFSIEIKNQGSLGSLTIAVDKEGRWIYNKAGIREVKENINKQTLIHVGVKRKLLNRKLKEINPNHEYINIQPIIVFANDSVEIAKNEGGLPILRINNLIEYIDTTVPDRKFSWNDLELYKSILERESVGAATFPVEKSTPEILTKLNIILNLYLGTIKATSVLEEMASNFEATVPSPKEIEVTSVDSIWGNIKRKPALLSKLIIGLVVAATLLYGGKLGIESYKLKSSISNFTKTLSKAVDLQDVNLLTTLLEDKDVEEEQKKAFLTLLKEDKNLIDDIEKTIKDMKKKKSTSVGPVIITSEKKFGFFSQDIDLRTIYGDDTEIFINGIKQTDAYISLIPGIYEIYGEIKNGELKSNKVKLNTKENTDIKLEYSNAFGQKGEYISISTNNKDGYIYINGKKISPTISNVPASGLGPVIIGQSKLSLGFNTPWEEKRSEEVIVNSRNITLNYLPTLEDKGINVLFNMAADNVMNDGYWKAVAKPIKFVYDLDSIRYVKSAEKNSKTYTISFVALYNYDNIYPAYKGNQPISFSVVYDASSDSFGKVARQSINANGLSGKNLIEKVINNQ